MNTFRFSEEQRQAWVMDKYTRRKTVRKICKEAGISRATLYNWMKEFPMPAALADEQEEETVAVHRDEMAFPKHDISSKYEMLLSALAQADNDKQVSRKMVQTIVKRYTLTVAQACAIIGIDEAVYGYKPRKPEVDDTIVHDELARLTHEDPSRGFIDCYKLLQVSHPKWTRKQIKRVYREKRLYLRRIRVKRSKTQTAIVEQLRLHRYSTVWNTGVIFHEKYCILFIIDEQDGAPLNAAFFTGIPEENEVTTFLSLAMEENGKPRKLKIPGKVPYNGKEVTRGVWEHKAALQTLNLAKPENEAEVSQMEAAVGQQLFNNMAGQSEEEVRSLTEAWIQTGVNTYK